jgi:hypothetical protein
MGKESLADGSAAQPVDAVFASVGVRAHSAASVSTSGSSHEIPPASASAPSAFDLEAEAEELRARLRETREDLTTLGALSESAFAEILGMGGGVEAEAESLLAAFAGLDSFDALGADAASTAADLSARMRVATPDSSSRLDVRATNADAGEVDLDARIAEAEARLAATRRARDEAAAARSAVETEKRKKSSPEKSAY